MSMLAPISFFSSRPSDADVPSSGLPSVSNRPRNTTEVLGTFQVTRYLGLQHGRSGIHELVEGTFTAERAARPQLVDTQNVELALNVQSQRDPHGLPHELPLHPGQMLTVEGEYIPASATHRRNANGPEAVLHFTHAPGGFVVLDGSTYRFVAQPNRVAKAPDD